MYLCIQSAAAAAAAATGAALCCYTAAVAAAAAAVCHRVPDGKNCCWFIETEHVAFVLRASLSGH